MAKISPLALPERRLSKNAERAAPSFFPDEKPHLRHILIIDQRARP